MRIVTVLLLLFSPLALFAQQAGYGLPLIEINVMRMSNGLLMTHTFTITGVSEEGDEVLAEPTGDPEEFRKSLKGYGFHPDIFGLITCKFGRHKGCYASYRLARDPSMQISFYRVDGKVHLEIDIDFHYPRWMNVVGTLKHLEEGVHHWIVGHVRRRPCYTSQRKMAKVLDKKGYPPAEP